MLHALEHAVLDTLKTLPFLFAAYLLIEFLEHKASSRLTSALSRAGGWGPLGGAVLGCVPQCGISVAASNFYAGRLISAGTLMAVFFATSDEALPILLSRPEAYPDILRLLAVKLVSAVALGFLVDIILKNFIKTTAHEPFHDLCENCDCEHEGIFRSALRHTVKIAVFLLAVNIILGIVIHFTGEESISKFLLSGSAFQPLLTGLIGFIPNCAASVILTELYLSGSLSFGSAVAGLCTGAGMGIAVLFRINKHPRENFAIVGVLYVAAVITGVLCNIIF